ncbi:MAG: hypothetical protein K6E27_04790 [Eubacterium sp.]|nr:hypothetical protein [Eubacterium sp.]
MYEEMDIDVMIGISDEELPTGREIPVAKKEESLEDLGIDQVAEPEKKEELKVEAKEYTAPDPEEVRAPEPVPVEKKHRGITEVLVGLVKRA